MLVDIPLKNPDPMMNFILNAIGQNDPIREIHDGIYLCPHFNFSNCVGIKLECLPHIQISEDNYISACGVCDTIDQFRDQIASQLHESSKPYVCSLTKVTKAEQPSNGGWRWHKWGPYIGTKNPRCEYLYNEGSEFEEVYVFQIYEIL